MQIFLPILLFKGAYNLDWHIFKKEIPSIFMLSFPCVLLNAVFMQMCIKIIFYTDNVLH